MRQTWHETWSQRLASSRNLTVQFQNILVYKQHMSVTYPAALTTIAIPRLYTSTAHVKSLSCE